MTPTQPCNLTPKLKVTPHSIIIKNAETVHDSDGASRHSDNFIRVKIQV